MNNNQLLTETQAAALAQVQPKTIADWGRAGKLPRVRLSARCIRYRRRCADAHHLQSRTSWHYRHPQIKTPKQAVTVSGSRGFRTTKPTHLAVC